MILSLRCDFDRALPRDWLARVGWCARLWRWRLIAVAIHRTARGYHAIVSARMPLADENAAYLVAAQAILQSDWKREAFNLLRAYHISLGSVPPFWRSRWNVLYERHSRPHGRGSHRRGNRST